jgi:hypothetical protein
MKKIAYFLSIGALASMIVFSGCKKDEEVDTTACENQTFPSNTGTATVAVKNYVNVSGDFTVIDANAGDNLSFAVEITKGTNRPQKLRIYQTDCANKRGDIVSLAGQPGAEDGDTRLDLRNTDDAQIRQFLYTVPTGMSTVYLNIEIDESGDKYTYKRVKLNVAGSGIIDSWSGITLGAQSNAAASRMSSGTGQSYTACNAAANMEYIDITYASNADGYLCSNPARFLTPIGLGNTNPSCGDDGSLPTNGGTATYFKTYAGSDFATITDDQLNALTVSSSNNQYINFTAANGVYEFLNAKGKKGLIKVTSYAPGNSGSITVDVKVQR